MNIALYLHLYMNKLGHGQPSSRSTANNQNRNRRQQQQHRAADNNEFCTGSPSCKYIYKIGFRDRPARAVGAFRKRNLLELKFTRTLTRNYPCGCGSGPGTMTRPNTNHAPHVPFLQRRTCHLFPAFYGALTNSESQAIAREVFTPSTSTTHLSYQNPGWKVRSR